MLKIIFLDLDGCVVLPPKYNIIDPVAQKNLEVIIRNTEAKIVLSSSHRRDTVEETKAHLTTRLFEFNDRLVGVTIRGYTQVVKNCSMSIPRGVEIKHWVDNYICRENNQGPYTKKIIRKDYNYVILDDAEDMLYEQRNHFVWVRPTKGLTLSDAYRAIKILNG